MLADVMQSPLIFPTPVLAYMAKLMYHQIFSKNFLKSPMF